MFVKLTEAEARTLLGMVIGLKRRMGDQWRDYQIEGFDAHYGLFRDLTRGDLEEVSTGVLAADAALSNLRRDDPTPQKALEALCAQIAGLSAPSGDASTLLDTVTEILHDDFARNRLSGETLKNLRKALLLPSESRAIAEHLRNHPHLNCTRCGREILDNMLVSVRERGIICSVCDPPHFQPCATPDCKEHAKIHPKVASLFLRPRFCEGCVARQKAQEAGENQSPFEAGGEGGIVNDVAPIQESSGRAEGFGFRATPVRFPSVLQSITTENSSAPIATSGGGTDGGDWVVLSANQTRRTRPFTAPPTVAESRRAFERQIRDMERARIERRNRARGR